MSEIYDVREIFKRVGIESLPLALENTERILIAAILDPTESIRIGHINYLNEIFVDTLQGGFVADNQLYLILEGNELLSGTYCICDTPKTYAGSKRMPHRFYRQDNRFISE